MIKILVWIIELSKVLETTQNLVICMKLFFSVADNEGRSLQILTKENLLKFVHYSSLE